MVVVLYTPTIKDTLTSLYYYFCFEKCCESVLVKQQMSVFRHGVDEFIIREKPQRDEILLYF